MVELKVVFDKLAKIVNKCLVLNPQHRGLLLLFGLLRQLEVVPGEINILKLPVTLQRVR